MKKIYYVSYKGGKGGDANLIIQIDFATRLHQLLYTRHNTLIWTKLLPLWGQMVDVLFNKFIRDKADSMHKNQIVTFENFTYEQIDLEQYMADHFEEFL